MATPQAVSGQGRSVVPNIIATKNEAPTISPRLSIIAIRPVYWACLSIIIEVASFIGNYIIGCEAIITPTIQKRNI